MKATNVFRRNFNSTKKIVVNRGGSRSSKTYSLCQIFARWLLTGELRNGERFEKGVASFVRATFPALRDTVIRDFVEILTDWRYINEVEHHKQEKTFTYEGRMIEYFSIDDQQKVRGRRRNFLWVNEGNELSYEDWRQLIMRTDGVVFIDFNPDDPETWINTKLEQERAAIQGDVEVIVSSYKDNPFLHPSLIAEIELASKLDAEFGLIFGQGQYQRITGQILTNWTIVDEMPKEIRKHGFGMDFGFTNDPTAFVECGLQDGKLYVNELIYQRGLTNTAIIERLRELNIRPHDTIIADSAEPKSITEIQNAGFMVLGATKGSDSIRKGIDTLKSYQICVTANSVNIIKELKSWKWKMKDGASLGVPMDANNHAIDAIRYYASQNLESLRTVVLTSW